MASASSSSFFSESIIQGDVFIHFCEEDVGRNFVSHLNSALLQAGVKASLFGEVMPRSIFRKSIQRFQIGIVVFTKKYSEYSWCFDDFEKIIERHETEGLMVMPVFYEIDPSDGGIYMDKETSSQSWRSALTKAANLPTLDGSKHRNDAELVEEIVKSVLAKLECPLSMTKFPVGLEPHVKHVIGLFENLPSITTIIGIWGMGGSGKTTVAKAVYNQILCRFRHKSFIQDIRQVCETDDRGLVHLQEQLLSDVLKENVKIESGGMEKTMTENRLREKKSFIVLDDVNEIDQVKNLCGSRPWFGQGSVIIITTRNVDLLYRLRIDYVYEMDKMDEIYSVELFSWHAFREAKPKEDFNELARDAVAYCGGLPLALEVIGSYLSKRSEKEWRSVLSKLEVIPNTQVQNKLRISFDGLCQTEKEIFLDICCFFIGKERGYVTKILNGCGLHADIGIKILIERGLIKIVKNNKLGMHNLLRDMGREIVRQSSTMQPGKRSRLWFQEDVRDVLANSTGTDAIEGLTLKLNLTNRECFKADTFEKMRSLRLLQLHHVELTGDFGYLSKQLRWIYWQGFPSKYIPNNFYLGDAIAISFKHSNLRKVWKEPKALLMLKFLNLSHSKYLTEIPDFSGLPNLEELILKDCPSLVCVHKSIGDLCNIVLINLKDCTSLSNLPREIYKLKSLKTLILSGCLKIDKLEEDTVQMESLTTLIADNTYVKKIPFLIVSPKSIGYMSLCGFEGLARNVFPSIIQSWMSPKINPLFYILPFSGTSCSFVSMSTQNNNTLGELVPALRILSDLRSVLVQCETEIQLSKHVKTILDEDVVNFTELEISRHHLRSSLIGVGSYKAFFDILNHRISEGLATNEDCEVLLPGDNLPYWLAHTGEGRSVYFTVPEDCAMKGMVLCIVYLSNPEIMATECLTSVLIANYTKRTLQIHKIHKPDTVIFFNDKHWQEIISHLEGGDEVEIFVTFGHDLVVKKTAVYLMCGESNDIEIEPTHCESDDVEIEPRHCESNDIEIKAMRSESNDIEIEPLHCESNDIEIEPMHCESNALEIKSDTKPNGNAFTRLLKKFATCDW